MDSTMQLNIDNEGDLATLQLQQEENMNAKQLQQGEQQLLEERKYTKTPTDKPQTDDAVNGELCELPPLQQQQQEEEVQQMQPEEQNEFSKKDATAVEVNVDHSITTTSRLDVDRIAAAETTQQQRQQEEANNSSRKANALRLFALGESERRQKLQTIGVPLYKPMITKAEEEQKKAMHRFAANIAFPIDLDHHHSPQHFFSSEFIIMGGARGGSRLNCSAPNLVRAPSMPTIDESGEEEEHDQEAPVTPTLEEDQSLRFGSTRDQIPRMRSISDPPLPLHLRRTAMPSIREDAVQKNTCPAMPMKRTPPRPIGHLLQPSSGHNNTRSSPPRSADTSHAVRSPLGLTSPGSPLAPHSPGVRVNLFYSETTAGSPPSQKNIQLQDALGFQESSPFNNSNHISTSRCGRISDLRASSPELGSFARAQTYPFRSLQDEKREPLIKTFSQRTQLLLPVKFMKTWDPSPQIDDDDSSVPDSDNEEEEEEENHMHVSFLIDTKAHEDDIDIDESLTSEGQDQAETEKRQRAKSSPPPPQSLYLPTHSA